MDRGAWWAPVHVWGSKELGTTEWLTQSVLSFTRVLCTVDFKTIFILHMKKEAQQDLSYLTRITQC